MCAHIFIYIHIPFETNEEKKNTQNVLTLEVNLNEIFTGNKKWIDKKVQIFLF